MSDNVIQTSFASGELSPSLFARVDFAKYHSGAATMRNFFVDYRSGASTRAGTEFIMAPIQLNGPVRLVRFQQSVDVTYVLVFGNQYLRFITQGGAVVETSFPVGGITQGTSTILNIPGNNYAIGQLIFVQGVAGVPQINGRFFVVGAVS